MEYLWDGAYGLYTSFKKTWKSNHMQMQLQRQLFLVSYFKTLSDDSARDELTTFCMTADAQLIC